MRYENVERETRFAAGRHSVAGPLRGRIDSTVPGRCFVVFGKIWSGKRDSHLADTRSRAHKGSH